MPTWKDSLCDASAARTLERASGRLARRTEYVLGRGGFNPELDLEKKCDCSGFVAWAIGVPRELPPRSARWLDTDAYWGGGGSARNAAGFPLFTEVPKALAQPGDIIVYPDRRSPRRSEGHMGIITSADGGGGMTVVHCSKGNWRRHGDAIRETDASLFDADTRTRVVRPDYPALRRYCGVPEPVPTDAGGGGATVTPPRTGGGALRHPLLAESETLRRVLAGELILERANMAVSGINAIQQAFKVLARGNPSLRIDLGPNDRNAGVYGPKTERALQRFQEAAGLPATGDVDAATLRELDRQLVAHAEATDGETEEEDTIGRLGEELEPEPEPAADAQEIVFTTHRTDNRWKAAADGGARFYVGRRVRFTSGGVTRRGLLNNDDPGPAVYQPAPYVERFGHWAYLIHPTAMAESRGRFGILNTYDRARFTFGFLQFAAHVQDGDFVRFFRALLADEGERRRYFPDLELSATTGRIMRRTSGGLLPLETAASTSELMRYLNPSDADVEEREVLQAAKFIHWCANSARHREEQVRCGVATAKRLLAAARTQMELDGRGDKVCLMVMDILHHGRAKYSVIRPRVEDNNDEDAYRALLRIGTDTEYIAQRVATIRQQVETLEAAGHLGHKRYSSATGDFE